MRALIVVAIALSQWAAASPARAMTDEEMHQAILEIYRPRAEAVARKAAERKAREAALAASCKKLGGAAIGMTREQIVKSCWGKPQKVNETLTARGKHEQWVYAGGYLYLDDGLLTSIQTSR